jgi:WD40 repeat protein/tRNA A-37 threonylcarbamoyl transferase component Bud32
MPAPGQPPDSQPDPLDAVIAEYLQQIEAGAVPDREAWLARHPELADRLRAFLADYDRLDRQAGELRLSGDPQRTTAAAPGADATGLAELPRVRYFGDYELLEEIARGGMGVVYKARQTSLNRIVALKMILQGELATPLDVARFRVEAEAAAGLDHPNIVPVYEVGEHEGQQYYSMRLIEGTSLARVPRGDLRGGVAVLATVARAVHYAHQRGILHRDLKPANILIDVQGQPHLTDFGLARRMQADTSLSPSGAIVGTPSYMAPEQAAPRRGSPGSGLTTRADVYSLGAILYDLLTGRPPFRAETPLDTLLLVLEREPERPRSLNAQVDLDLETICLKCLQKEAGKRYASAEALAEDLERWLGGEPIVARPVGMVERFTRWCRRNRGIAASLAGLFASLSVGIIVASLLAVAARRNADRADREAAGALAREQEARENESVANENAERARQEKRFSDRRHYVSEIARAMMDWEAAEIGRMLQRLEQFKPRPGEEDLRGFEWYYLQRRCQLDFRSFDGGGSAVAFSPDGKRFASSGFDGTVKVWDVATSNQALTLRGHSDAVRGVAFSPDGKRLASASRDGTVKVWDAATGREIRSLHAYADEGLLLFAPTAVGVLATPARSAPFFVAAALLHESLSADVTGVAYSPNGRRIAAARFDGTVKVWDAGTGEEALTLRGHSGGVRGVAFSPDSRRIASASEDHTVRVWDAATGKVLLTLAGHTARVMAVAFSPDGRRLASGGFDRALMVWDATTGKEILRFRGHGKAVMGVAVSPDGRRIASVGGDRMVKVWDATTGRELFALRGDVAGLRCVAYSPDGRHLASASENGSVKLWDAAAGQHDLSPGEPIGFTIMQSAISSFGSREDSWDSMSLDADSGFATLNGSGVAFRPKSSHLMSARGWYSAVTVWDSVTGQPIRTLRGHVGRIGNAAFSPDGRQFAIATADNTVTVFDAETGQETLTLRGHSSKVSGAAFSPDGQRLAAFCVDGKVRIWDVARRQEVLSLQTQHSGDITGISFAFSPDGRRFASTGSDKSIRMWDAISGQKVSTMRGGASDLAFSPDGQRIAAAGDEATAMVWDAATGRQTLTLRGHTKHVRGVAFSPDGRRLATASFDGTVKLWDAATGQEIWSFFIQEPPWGASAVAFSPDGKRLAATSDPGVVMIWDATPLSEETRLQREAGSLVRFQFARLLLRHQVVDAIRRDGTISEALRKQSISLATQWPEVSKALLQEEKPSKKR